MIQAQRPFFSRWLSLTCLLASGWITAYVAVSFALNRSERGFAFLLLALIGAVAFFSMGVTLLVHLRRVIANSRWWQKGECSSKAWGITIQVLTAVAVPLMALFALYLNALILIFHDNIQTGSAAQVLVVVSSIIAGLGAILALLVSSKRNWYGALGLVVAAVLCAWSHWCWIQPGVRGLIH